MSAYAQVSEHLCNTNEGTVFSFQLENNKWVSVCREQNGQYLVFRLGNQNIIELQAPAVIDSNSWKRFTFSGFNRGGGKENAAMHFGYLSFKVKDLIYEVYELWNSEDSIEHCGLTIIKGYKIINNFIGNLKSKSGNLVQLMSEPKIKQEEDN
jgi:hypothetical protein